MVGVENGLAIVRSRPSHAKDKIPIISGTVVPPTCKSGGELRNQYPININLSMLGQWGHRRFLREEPAAMTHEFINAWTVGSSEVS